MTQRAKPVRYRLSAHPAFPGDLAPLAVYGPEVAAAARTALDGLAHARVPGKLFWARPVSGNSTGLASVKFDIPGSPTRRLRLVTVISMPPRVACWPLGPVTRTRSMNWLFSA